MFIRKGVYTMSDYCPRCKSRLYPDDYEDVMMYDCCHYCTPNLEERKKYKENLTLKQKEGVSNDF